LNGSNLAARSPWKLHPNNNTYYFLLPAADILDVVSMMVSDLTSPYPLCSPPAPASIDRSFSYARVADDVRGLQRPVAYRSANGNPVLLRTKSSAVDFVAAPATPFQLLNQ